MDSARSPAEIVVLSQSAEVSEFENTTFGMSFIGLANCDESLGQCTAIAAYVVAPMRCALALLRVSTVHLSARHRTARRRSSRRSHRVARRIRQARPTSSEPATPSPAPSPGMDDTSKSFRPRYGYLAAWARFASPRGDAEPTPSQLGGEPGHIDQGVDVAARNSPRVSPHDASDEPGVLVVLDRPPSPVCLPSPV